MSLLEVADLQVARSGTPVLHGVSLRVEEHEAVCLLGRNGMGKTTLLRTIMGLDRPRGGRIRFLGKEVGGRPPYRVARSGIGYVPQGRQIFAELTVQENLQLTTSHGSGNGTMERIFSLFPILAQRRRQAGGTLSGGEQQMLAIARCMLLEPRLLLLDEPTEGLQPSVVQHLQEVLAAIGREFGLALLLVEQNLDFAFAVTSRGYVLEKGRIATEGSIASLREHAIIKEYLAV
jgi:branched-chain amino acid transport system ATP-binding protein